jgi:hypothetical protein
MSYELTFYAGSHDGLRKNLLQPSEDFLKRVGTKWESVYQPTGGESYDETLREGLHEITEAIEAGGDDKRLGVKAELALVAVIETDGKKLGSLAHSSSGGDEFREEFLDALAAKCFHESKLRDYLTHRPIYGITATSYPDWGYLLQTQIVQLVSGYKPPSSEIGSDMGRWLADLFQIFQRSKDEGGDLFTLYR